jgi:hypothetical protein
MRPLGSVLRGAGDAEMGDRGRVDGPGYAEVRHLHVSRSGDEDVVGLYVPVDDALVVSSL